MSRVKSSNRLQSNGNRSIREEDRSIEIFSFLSFFFFSEMEERKVGVLKS